MLELAFNPHQRRGPDGRWVKMPTNELKRPRRAKKPRAAKAVDAPARSAPRSEELPPINLPDPMVEYRRVRDEYNDNVLSVARYVADQNDLAGRNDDALAEYLAAAEQPDGEFFSQDDAVDDLRSLLDTRYRDVAMGLDWTPRRPETRPVPVLPPGPRTPGGPRPPLTDPYETRRQALDRSIRSGIDGQDLIGGGAMGDTRRVRLADGTEAIYKRAMGEWAAGWGKRDQTDAEELGAMVAAAVGVRAPAIQRADDDNLYMEIMPGGSAMSRRFYDDQGALADTPQGMRMGLLDVLLNNTDRHSGNWMIDDAGQIAAIDHGLAFKESRTNRSSATRSRFSTDHFIDSSGEYRERNPLTRLDVEIARQQLEAIRPRFEQLGRGAWYGQVLDRLDMLSARAAGFRSMLEDTPRMFSSRAAAAMATLRGPVL
jgi:phosphoinositide 3-/4-kinase-like protein